MLGSSLRKIIRGMKNTGSSGRAANKLSYEARLGDYQQAGRAIYMVRRGHDATSTRPYGEAILTSSCPVVSESVEKVIL